MNNLFSNASCKTESHSENLLKNQDGSVILVALMLLLTMSLIAFSASQTSVTESFILRNNAIRSQNISLVESAAMEIAERVLIDIREPAAAFLSETSATHEPFIIRHSAWDSTKKANWYTKGFSGRVLSGAANYVTDSLDSTKQWYVCENFSSTECQWVQPHSITELTLIDDVRGEKVTGINPDWPLRVGLVGWQVAPGSSMKGTKPTRKRGVIVAEYISSRYGAMRLELGIEREF